MKDKAHETDPAALPEDDSHEVESWLREAVHAPQAARLPNQGDIVGGKYRIEKLLGRGGMGAVFSARHIVSERSVAIKWMLRPASDEQAQRRFEREARAAGRIDHPNVVALYDIGDEGDCSYLVMELLRGESLRTRLSRGPIDAGEALDKLIPAMRGVAAAHRAGVIHRDLKPDNIFLCQGPDGDAPREAKVLDFGVSSIASKEPADSTLTQEGTLLGSLAYMSPEQLVNAHDADARADVYAFGVILYEVLTGTLPFRGGSYSALAVAIATARPERPSQIRRNLALGLEEVVLRALARERDERYQDMNGMIEALLPFRAASSARESDTRLASEPAPRASTPSSAGRVLGVPMRLSAGGSEAFTASDFRRGYRPQFALVAASLLVVAVLWLLVSRWHDTGTAVSPITPSPSVVRQDIKQDTPLNAPAAPDTPPSPVAPALPAAPPAVQSTATKVAQPSNPAPKAARPRATRTAAGARAKAAPEKNAIETSEDVLFSGRK